MNIIEIEKNIDKADKKYAILNDRGEKIFEIWYDPAIGEYKLDKVDFTQEDIKFIYDKMVEINKFAKESKNNLDEDRF